MGIENLPEGVLVTERVKNDKKYLFVMNFSREERVVSVPGGTNLLTGEKVSGSIKLSDNGMAVIET